MGTIGEWLDVQIIADNGDTPRMQFRDGERRYHVWLERETLRPRPTTFGKGAGSVVLYANPLNGGGKTQCLRGDSTRWSPVIESLLGRFDVAGERQRIANEAQRRDEERQRENAERERQERVRELAPRMRDFIFALIRDDMLNPGTIAEEEAHAIIRMIDAT